MYGNAWKRFARIGKRYYMDRKKTAAYIGFAVIMIALGASDALKGVFAPIFETHFALTNTQLSAVITVGYIGNLMFLISGGGLADRYKIKTVFLAALLAWMGALMLYLVTDNYYCLLIGVFVTMGTSTFMNTMINLMSPLIFTGASAIAVNTLFFVQGIGTAGSQKLAGMYAGGFGSWKLVNGLLLALGLLGLVFVVLIRVPEPKSAAGGKWKAEKKERGEGYAKDGNARDGNTKDHNASDGNSSGGNSNANDTNATSRTGRIVRNPAFPYLVLILGFYFIAEHGILNWFVTYGTRELGLTVVQASTCLSVFFGGIMAGRLIFAPLVQKAGIRQSITVFGGIGTVLYSAGIIFGKNTIWLLAAAGIFFSILYPMLITMLRFYYGQDVIFSASGFIISLATVFDIGFNACFGKVTDIIGFSKSFLILPVCMVLFYICFLLFQNNVKRN